MQGNFKALILSYKNTPVEIRELFALSHEERAHLLQSLPEVFGMHDLLVLSTCNRTEIYYSADRNVNEEIIAFILRMKGTYAKGKTYTKYFEHLLDTDTTVNYLFRVAMGLEAQVVGDIQVVNQVKGAYQQAADFNTAGPFLHRLLHSIFYANKRVVQETAFKDGAASISYAAAELIKTLSESFVDPKILVLGLGEIGKDAVKNLAESGLQITLSNRSADKAFALSEETGFDTLDFSASKMHWDHYDIILSSVMVKDFISLEDFKDYQPKGIKYFIDLSIPRSIDFSIERIDGFSLFNIDEIKDKTEQAIDKRIAAIPQVEQIIAELIADFSEWSHEIEVSPTIQKIKSSLETIRQEEIKKHLKHASPEMEEFAEKLSRSLTQKIMKLPILQLKAACKRGEADQLVDVLNDLFDVEKQQEKIK